MIRRVLFSSTVFVFAGSAVFAAPPATLSQDRLTTSISPAVAAQLQAKFAKNGGGGLVNNFAKGYKNGLYWCCAAGTISGQNSFVGVQVVQGVPFTPKASKSVTTITVAASYSSGTDSMTIGLYSDSNNLPGTELASGTVTNLEPLGVCCSTVSVTIPATQLTKGTQYWVVLSSPDDSWEGWNDSTIDQVHTHTIAYNQNNTGWTTYTLNLTFALDVK